MPFNNGGVLFLMSIVKDPYISISFSGDAPVVDTLYDKALKVWVPLLWLCKFTQMPLSWLWFEALLWLYVECPQ